jgi:hypothetical protein
MTQTVPAHDWADASTGGMNSVLAPARMHLANAARKYEGACVAYVDFVEHIGAPVDVRHRVLGIIRLPGDF